MATLLKDFNETKDSARNRRAVGLVVERLLSSVCSLQYAEKRL